MVVKFEENNEKLQYIQKKGNHFRPFILESYTKNESREKKAVVKNNCFKVVK